MMNRFTFLVVVGSVGHVLDFLGTAQHTLKVFRLQASHATSENESAIVVAAFVSGQGKSNVSVEHSIDESCSI